jgi:hypothetical protein
VLPCHGCRPGWYEVLSAAGAAHLPDFGPFASPDRRLIFDLNGFADETYADRTGREHAALADAPVTGSGWGMPLLST